MSPKYRISRSGFSLVELIVVMIIIRLLDVKAVKALTLIFRVMTWSNYEAGIHVDRTARRHGFDRHCC